MLTGGHGHAERGRFYEPTVLVDVDHTMTIMREETFGPTLPIMKVASAEEGIRLANDSDYGLQASVWTKDLERGEPLARRIQAGSVCVNDAQTNYLALNLPMGGWKSSGDRHPPRRQRDPQVLQDPVAARDPLRAQARSRGCSPTAGARPCGCGGCSRCCTGAASATETSAARRQPGAQLRRLPRTDSEPQLQAEDSPARRCAGSVDSPLLAQMPMPG